jgi:hypothetical protein
MGEIQNAVSTAASRAALSTITHMPNLRQGDAQDVMAYHE